MRGLENQLQKTKARGRNGRTRFHQRGPANTGRRPTPKGRQCPPLERGLCAVEGAAGKVRRPLKAQGTRSSRSCYLEQTDPSGRGSGPTGRQAPDRSRNSHRRDPQSQQAFGKRQKFINHLGNTH